MTNIHEYNGWTNRATWLVNLRFNNSMEDVIHPILDDLDTNSEETLDNIEETLRDWHNELIKDETNGMSSYIIDSLDFSMVNYRELAQAVIDSYEA